MLMQSVRIDPPRGFRLSGEVDISNENDLAGLLEPEVALGGDITLDLSGLGFMDSSGIRVLLRSASELAGRGGSMFLSGAREGLRRVFDVMGVERAPGLVIVAAAAEGLLDPGRPGTARDLDGGSHRVIESRCACGCPYLYSADDLALFWEPGERFDEDCCDRSCQCHVAPLRG
jgi:anti-anti-sigma factor